MRGHIRRGIKRILLVAPTGSGKGTMAAHMIHQASHRNKRIGFLVNRRELVKDLSRRLDGLGVEHGIIMADDPRVKPWLNVHVASIDSLHRRDIPAWDLVFLDEAHFSISPIWKSVTDRLGAAVLIGMTATPVRADGRGLEEMYDVMVRCPDTPALIEREFLVPPRVFAPPPPDLKGIKSTAGEYNQKELGTRMNTRVITGNILEHWLRHGRGRPTIGFGVTVEHSKAMTAQFCEAGIRAEHVDALTPDRDNGRGGNWRDGEDGIWVRLARYEIEVVFNVGIAGYGWDCPPVSCMIEARPTKSLALWLQHCGRVLRSYPLKRDAIILDHAGNTLRHQPPDWPRDWTLASKPKADKSSSSSSSSDVHQCQACFFVYEGNGACPECGFVDKGGLEHREGTLGEVLPQFICAACKADMPGAAAGDPCDVCRRGYAKRIYRIKKLSKNRIIAAWQMEAAEKGYAPAWLFHKIERLKANGWQQA